MSDYPGAGPPDPSGAIDSDSDDAERDPKKILTDKLAAFPRQIKATDVVIDMVEGRPLFVRRQVADTAVEYFDREDFDLTTYKAHPWLPITPEDPIYECVFLPTKPSDIPSEKKNQTYDYPRGRLARVPVEWLYGSDTRPQEEFLRTIIGRLFQTVDDVVEDEDPNRAADQIHRWLSDVAKVAFGDAIVDDALAEVGFDVQEDDGGDE